MVRVEEVVPGVVLRFPTPDDSPELVGPVQRVEDGFAWLQGKRWPVDVVARWSSPIPKPPSKFIVTLERCREEARRIGWEPFSLWPMTDSEFRLWRAMRGNAKSRRRWRRTHPPASQGPAEGQGKHAARAPPAKRRPQPG